MHKKKTKIFWCWISWIVIFTIVFLTILIYPYKIKCWGIVICLIYWIGLIFFYIKEYNGLKNAVFRRFPKVYKKVFKQLPNLKDKYKKIDNWDINPITSEMYYEDLNIKNRVLRIKELDIFRIVVFVSLLLIMIVSIFVFS